MVEQAHRKRQVAGSSPASGSRDVNSHMEKKERDARIQELEAAMSAPDFWSNPSEAQNLIKELQDLKVEAEGGTAYDRGNAIMTIVAGAGGDDA